MNSVTMRATCALGLLISLGGLSGCAISSSGNGSSAGNGQHAPTLGARTGAATPAAHASTASAGVCVTTQRDLTAAMNDLQITDFSGWALSLTTGDVVGGATMTRDLRRLTNAFKVTAALMSTRGSSSSPVARTVGDDLSDTGGDFEDLISGNGTVSDEAVIVHAFSNAVAATVALCGPDSFTRYAPAQEAAMDDLHGMGVDYSGELGSLASIIAQSRTGLNQEKHLSALGPQGNGGSCTIALQMGIAAHEIAQGSGSQFAQRLSSFTFTIALTQRGISKLQSDLRVTANQRLTPPANVTAAVAGAQQAISKAVVNANQLIDTENSLISESFFLANSMAKIPSISTTNGSYYGSCAGDGPGNVEPFLIRAIT
jgi:hypothetical protein